MSVRDFLLAFADDEHLMGQQHTEWIGVAPFLEEDLAFSSIGQDELGHAVMLYELVCEIDGVEPTDEAIDALAYRSAEEYRSCAFAEFVTTDWAEALVRHWIYDVVEDHRWQLVAESSLAPLASAAVRAQREETYHRRHAKALVDSLMATPARSELQRAVGVLSPLIPSLLAPAAGEDDVISAKIASASLSVVAEPLADAIQASFEQSTTIDVGSVGRIERSAYFGPLMARMREVLDLDPEAVW